jgi:Tol biopolymer transport system component
LFWGFYSVNNPQNQVSISLPRTHVKHNHFLSHTQLIKRKNPGIVTTDTSTASVYNTFMRSRLLVPMLLILILILGLVIAYLGLTPRLVEVTPEGGSTSVAAGTPIQLTFSRPMEADTIIEQLSIDPPVNGSFSWEANTLTYTPEEPWPSGDTIMISMRPGARSASFPKLSSRGDTSWSFKIRQPLLAYLYPANEAADIYAINLQTGEVEKLTDIPGEVLDFDVDSTGSRIYFNTSHGDGGSALHTLDILTGEVETIIECPQALCRYPKISPLGDYLAYERTSLSGLNLPNQPQVWLLPLSTNEDTPGEPFLIGDIAHQTQQPLWSVSGLLAYYNYSLSAFIIQEPNGEVYRQLPSQTGVPGDWSPDGESYLIPEIIIEAIEESETLTDLKNIPSSHLLRYDLSDNSTHDLTQLNNLEDTSPAFSPDGTTLAFARKFLDVTRWTPGRQLWTMKPDGSDTQQLTDDPYYNHYDFAWSPTGDQIAYTRFNKNLLTEPPQIWLMNADGSTALELISGGYAPQWIP